MTLIEPSLDGLSVTPQEALFIGVAFAKEDAVRAAVAVGASLSARNDSGRTPLTEAILGGMGDSRIVDVLLELGADPDLKDAEGWSPWIACLSRLDDPVVASRQRRIHALLEKAGASRSDEAAFALYQAVCAGDIARVRALLGTMLPEPWPLSPRSAAVGCNRIEILRLLDEAVIDSEAPRIARGGEADLVCAVRSEHLEIVEYLLARGADPEGAGVAPEGMSCLMLAAQRGRQDIAELLLRHGARLDRAQDEKGYWTARRHASGNKHKAMADWLKDPGAPPRTPRTKEAPITAPTEVPEKFAPLIARRSSGGASGPKTRDILERLLAWDMTHGVELLEARPRGVVIQFLRLPEDVAALAQEISEFCPGVFAHFEGALARQIATMRNLGVPEEQIAPVAAEHADYGHLRGLPALERALRWHRTARLSWR